MEPHVGRDSVVEKSGETWSPLRAGWYLSASVSATELTGKLQTFEEGRWTLEIVGAPACGVDVYHFEYDTVDGAGAAVMASAALMTPRDGRANPKPVVVGLHGTMPDKPYNLADLSGANPASERALAWAGVYASQGYIVVAPNYTGLDTSNASHQSYMHAEQQSEDVINALAAARALLPLVSCEASDKLFLAGYSQGGWLAMATHRKMEAANMALTASAPMSGAYALMTIVDDIFSGRPVQGSTIYMPLAVRAYQEAYGDLYERPADIYNPALADDLATLLPNDTPHFQLIQAGRLPATALFSDAAAVPNNASPFIRKILEHASPARTPEKFAHIYEQGFGANYLINGNFRVSYLKDLEKHPDGAWPDYSTGNPPAYSANGLRRAAIRSDLRGWTPKRPIMMCGGQDDAATPLCYGGDLMMRYWSDPGRAPEPGIVSLLDFEAASEADDPFEILRADFKRRKAEFLKASAMPGWVDPYHQLLLPRYCYAAARQFFGTFL